MHVQRHCRYAAEGTVAIVEGESGRLIPQEWVVGIVLRPGGLLSILMRASWLRWSFVLLSGTGCVPRPDEIREEIRAGAVAAVTGHTDGATTSLLPLRVEANPWGAGFLVFTTEAGRIEDITVWLYYPDLGWSFPPREKRNRLFALNSGASRLTPRAQRFEAADAAAQSKSGLQSQPKSVIEEVVFYAIREDVHVHDARQAIAGHRGTGPSKTRAP